jgi:isopentenyldiphosphate isomerase
MIDELLDFYSKENEHIGITKRSEVHNFGFWHRAAHVWLYNSIGDILLQLRSKDKQFYPGLWDVSCAGHVGEEESCIESALRELKEEIGVIAKEEELELVKIIKKETKYEHLINKEFYYVYLLKYESEIDKSRLQKEEVDDIKWIHHDELSKDLKKNPSIYVCPDGYWNYAIGEIKKRI